MKRSPSSRRGRSSREADRLVQYAEGLAQSGSRAEDRFWERQLQDEVGSLLSANDEAPLSAALDRLADTESSAYEELADAIEGAVEFDPSIQFGDKVTDVILIAAPILAWSRMPLPAKKIPASVLEGIAKELNAQVFAQGVRITLADHLFSPDQLPETFGETTELRQKLTVAAQAKTALKVAPSDLKESMEFLADVRYVLGVASVSAGAALFKWQEGLFTPRDQALDAWRQGATPVFNALLPSCAFELMLPGAYYVACRDADRMARPFSVKASVAYLATLLSVTPSQLFVTVGACYDRRLEEFRIGFSIHRGEDVLHGIVWPLLGAEDEFNDALEEIERTLRAAGIQHIQLLDQRLPLEYCDDCGSPMYPNSDGDLVHASPPEESSLPSQHLH